MTVSTPSSSLRTSEALWSSPFLKACRREPAEVTPIWLMRQAGRYMAEYRAIRDKVSFLELCKRPELATEVTVTAAERLGVDAAILFADILLILEPLGLDLEFAKGEGPVIHNPVRTAADVDRIRPLGDIAPLAYVMEAVRSIRAALPPTIPLIGFAGAPFTLACYAIEGAGSRHYEQAKSFMYRDPGAWNALMERLTEATALYLNAQAQAGAQALQVFDSWVGALSSARLPQVRTAAHDQALQPPGSVGSGHPLRDRHVDAPGITARCRRRRHRPRLAGRARSSVAAARVMTSPSREISIRWSCSRRREEIETQARRILAEAGGRPGHIFNLGHGILPQTPVDNVLALVDMVHAISRRS